VKLKLALMATIAVLTLPAGVADARSATHSEKAKMTSALKHEIRAARNPACKLGDFRVSSQDELYGAVTIKCHGRKYSEPLMERDPWHIVEHCVSENIGNALEDLNDYELEEHGVCDESTQPQTEAAHEANEEEQAKRLCMAPSHPEIVELERGQEFKCP